MTTTAPAADSLLRQLAELDRRAGELEHLMADPAVSTDPSRLQEIGRERADLEPIVAAYREYQATVQGIAEAEEMVAGAGPDRELAELAGEELQTLRQASEEQVASIRRLLVPKDPNDDKNVIIEIRAGTGGDEAALFAADLFRMYVRYAERMRWKVEVISETLTDGGGFREIIFQVNGRGAYSYLRYESGVHRVQRVPSTESQGRIHTSTASVAVLPEAEDVDIQIADNDLRIDVYRSSGNGGTHLRTGLVVTCQDEKSQLKNKLKAMTVLRSRLFDMEQQKANQERGDARRSQIGSGERSEKIRTYNFPQDRITDHRIRMSVSNIPGVLAGNLDPLLNELRAVDEAERLGEADAAD